MPSKHRTIPFLTPQHIQRFWSKIDKSPGQGPKGECWEWKASRSNGYGVFGIGNETFLANRVAYLIGHGEDLGDMQGCHHCDNPPCCRPEHIFKGTNKDNFLDAVKKNRIAHGDDHYTRRKPELRTVGEHVGTAKMTNIGVIEMRQLYDSKKITKLAVLANMFQPAYPMFTSSSIERHGGIFPEGLRRTRLLKEPLQAVRHLS